MDLKDVKNEILSCSTPIEQLFPPLPDSSSLVVAVRPTDFLASAIARAVEDTNAHLINLNVSAHRTIDDELLVHLRVDRRDGNSVAHSLERYGFRVVAIENSRTADPDDYLDEKARDRVNALLRYLEI